MDNATLVPMDISTIVIVYTERIKQIDLVHVLQSLVQQADHQFIIQ